MRNDTIPFHFSKSKTSSTTSPMCRLSGDGNNRTSGPCIHFIINQMSQSLIVDRTNKNRIFQLLPTVRIEHHFIPVLLITESMDLLGLILHIKWSEWSSIFTKPALQSSHLPDQCLNHMTNRHSGRNAVRIDYHIGHDPVHGEREVLLSKSHTACTLLPVTGGEFVTYLRNSNTSYAHFCELITSCIF